MPRRRASRSASSTGYVQISDDAPPFGRRATITRALFQLRGLQPGPATLVETGTLRNDTPSGLSGDGWSTMAWGWYCHRYGGKVTTIDLSGENLAVCRRVTEHYADVIEYVESDSLAFLRQWDPAERGPIHLLYLDSMDYLAHQQKESEEHHRAEAEAALPSLAAGCLILIDDTSPAGEANDNGVPALTGKGARAVPFLLERGFRLEWCLENQVLLSREACSLPVAQASSLWSQPFALSASFRSVLDALADTISARSLDHPLDLLTALQFCDFFYDEGEKGPAEAVAAYLASTHGWDPAEAERVGFTWAVVFGLRSFHRIAQEGRRARRRTRA